MVCEKAINTFEKLPKVHKKTALRKCFYWYRELSLLKKLETFSLQIYSKIALSQYALLSTFQSSYSVEYLRELATFPFSFILNINFFKNFQSNILLNFLAKILSILILRGEYSFSKYAKFSEKLKFLTYVCVSRDKKWKFFGKFCIHIKWMNPYDVLEVCIAERPWETSSLEIRHFVGQQFRQKNLHAHDPIIQTNTIKNQTTEEALQRCSYKKMFWKQVANLQENTLAEVVFSCKFLHIFRRPFPKNTSGGPLLKQ